MAYLHADVNAPGMPEQTCIVGTFAIAKLVWLPLDRDMDHSIDSQLKKRCIWHVLNPYENIELTREFIEIGNIPWQYRRAILISKTVFKHSISKSFSSMNSPVVQDIVQLPT